MKINKEFLIKKHKVKSVTQIAKENDISNTCLYRLFDKYKIKRRHKEYFCKDCGRKITWVYNYLVKLGIIKKYIKWFFKNYAVDLNDKG